MVLSCKALNMENCSLILCLSLFSAHMNRRPNTELLTQLWHHIACDNTFNHVSGWRKRKQWSPLFTDHKPADAFSWKIPILFLTTSFTFYMWSLENCLGWKKPLRSSGPIVQFGIFP